MAKVSVAKKDVTLDGVTFTWGDDAKTVEQFRFADLPAEMQAFAGPFGLGHKLGDSYSGCGGNVAIARESVQRTFDSLMQGEWNVTGDGIAAGPTLLAEALSRSTKQTIEESEKALKAASKQTIKELRANPDIKALMATVKAERAIAEADKLGAPKDSAEAASVIAGILAKNVPDAPPAPTVVQPTV